MDTLSIRADGVLFSLCVRFIRKTDTILWLGVAVKTSRGEGLVLKFATVRGADAAWGAPQKRRKTG